MGEVLEVYDLEKNRTLALKRPRAGPHVPGARLSSVRPPADSDPRPALLRHEFVILSQLAHPNVVEVYDFGFHGDTAYYTMELLTGHHPGANEAMPWRAVCRMLATLCEPLALLHARRLVHRDLSPRNVFVGADGSATLIDFGAMASMGAHHRPIGTPSCMAPEVWRREHLDGRADVYGLGALAYRALTGRHAYSTRVLAQLPLVWQTLPAPPSELVAGIPHALDQLVLSMLSLERDGRPVSVSEVMQRLPALGNLALESGWVAPPAALPMPVLVGRDKQLALARGFVARSRSGRGQACVVRGEQGSGRTRLLETLGQLAQEAGMRVVRASTGVLEAAPYALLRELTQALELAGGAELPALAPELQPSLELLCSDAPIGSPDEAAGLALQRAFVLACEQSSAQQPLCLAIDDVERADQVSLGVLAQLARRASSRAVFLALAASADKPEGGTPLAALLRQAVWIDTPPLGAAETETLVRSIFGEVPNVARAARWLYHHCHGLPDTCTMLCEYLVSSGAAKFVSGSWQLKEDFDSLELPTTSEHKLELALPGSTAGRELLELLSLLPRPFPLELSAYVSALPSGRGASALDDLVRAQLVSATVQGYVLRDPAALRWAREKLDPERSHELHRALAHCYLEHDDHHTIQRAFHLWRAGDLAAADQVVRQVQDSSQYGLRDLLYRSGGMPVPAEFLEEVLEHRKREQASPADLYALRGALVALAVVSDIQLVRYAAETLDRLRYDVGLDQWDQTDATLEPGARAIRCLELARDRYAACPAAERGLPAEHAIGELVRCIALLVAPCWFMHDIELIRKLSELIAPFADLSTTTRLIAQIAKQTHGSLVLGDRNIAQNRAMIAATAPDVASDIEPIMRDAIHHIRLFYLALDLGAEGRPEALELASKLETQPLYEVLGLQARRIYALGCGRFEEAQRFRRRRELQALRTERADNHLRFSVLREGQAAYQCSDLLELTRTVAVVEEISERYPGWRPWVVVLRAYVHLRVDEAAAAAELIESRMGELAPFSHAAWPYFATLLAEAKNELGDHARARELALTTREGTRGLGVTVDCEFRIDAALAIAQAGLGDPKGASAAIESVIEAMEREVGGKTVQVGMLREAACQIALIAKDYNAFSRHLDELGELYAHHPGLRARHARWVRKGRGRFHKLLAVLEKANAAKDWSAHLGQNLAERSTEGGSEYLLSFVLDALQIDAGQLYRVDAERRCQLLACRPDTDEPSLMAAVARTLDNWWTSDEEQTADEESETATIVDSQGRRYVPLWLTDPERPDEVRGLLLVNCSAERLARLTREFVKAVALHLETIGV